MGRLIAILLGGAALFAMGMGMGVPLLLIGASAGNLLPRAGAWMDSVKAVFGVMMLGILLGYPLPTAPILIRLRFPSSSQSTHP